MCDGSNKSQCLGGDAPACVTLTTPSKQSRLKFIVDFYGLKRGPREFMTRQQPRAVAQNP